MQNHHLIVAIASFLGGMASSFIVISLAPATPTEPGMSMSSMDMAAHTNHPMLMVDSSVPTPTLSLEVTPDTKDGYNLHIMTENYLFTPELAGQEAGQGGGHAHLYVNGVKIARLYSNWFHLSTSDLQPGENLIEVTLNANDHSEWMVGDTHIAATTVVTK